MEEKNLVKTSNAIVVDNTGKKIEFVLVHEYSDGSKEPYMYQMKIGEVLKFELIEKALSLLKPKWTGAEWIETATAEEIEATKPKPLPTQQPNPTDLALAEISMIQATDKAEIQKSIGELSILIGTMMGGN